jgi:hypothetical protein
MTLPNCVAARSQAPTSSALRVGTNKFDLVRRPLTSNEIEYGFAKMTTLVTVLAQNEQLYEFVNAKTASGRAYQAANFLLKIYWNGQRRVDTLYLLAARIVVQAVSLVLEIRDLDYYDQRLAVLENRWRRLPPFRSAQGLVMLENRWQPLPPFHGLLDIVPRMLRPGASSYAVAIELGLKDASNLRNRLDGALKQIEEKYGRYCNALPTPHQNVVRVGYTESVGSREIREIQLSPAERAERIAHYLKAATRPALSLINFNYICWLRIMHRSGAGSLIARYLERGAGIYRTYQCVADYLLQHEDVRYSPNKLFITAPRRSAKMAAANVRSSKNILAGQLESARSGPRTLTPNTALTSA